MTPEDQRIAIAEACGWILLDPTIHGCPYKKTNSPLQYRDLPDYLNDLNDMHEAEMTVIHIDTELRHTYREWIHEDIFCPAHIRAEAFLKTIGKWKD